MIETRFKKTDIGEVPEDWKIKKIGEICDITTGNHNTQDKIENGLYPFFVRSPQVERINSFSFDCEAVLTAGDGVGTGKVFHYINGKFEVHQRVYVMRNFVKNTAGKFFYWYFSENFHSRVHSMTAKSSVDSVRKKMIAEMDFLLPPFNEQQRIATALSDIDALLCALNKKIEKKKLIKQGAMQQLLTGKKRLAGFTEPWIEKELGYVCDIKDGTHQTPKYEQSGIPFYSVETVTNNNFKHVKYISAKEHLQLTQRYRIEKGDVLMTRIGSIGLCKYIDWDVYASFYVSLALLKFESDSLAKYFAHYSMTRDFQMDVNNHSLQFATPKKINLGNIKLVKIKYPSSKSEQTAIATILSDMDKEIEQLEAKRAKYEQVKQGMMQQLLTGKIRLIDE